MVKNSGKGGKSKRKGKNVQQEDIKREVLLKEPGQEYAKIVKILGNCRAEVFCFDGKTRLSHFRGNFRKRVWIERDDVVLVGLRDFEDAKCDVIHKYSAGDVVQLKNLEQIPASFLRNEKGEEEVVFEKVSESSDEEEEKILTIDGL